MQHLEEEEGVPQEQQYNLARDREMRQIRLLERYVYENLVVYALSVVENTKIQEPCTYHDAITSGNSTQWTVAMSEEIESLHKNHTWQLVRLPKG